MEALNDLGNHIARRVRSGGRINVHLFSLGLYSQDEQDDSDSGANSRRRQKVVVCVIDGRALCFD